MSRGQKIILISQTDRLTDSEAYILLGISIGSDRIDESCVWASLCVR